MNQLITTEAGDYNIGFGNDNSHTNTHSKRVSNKVSRQDYSKMINCDVEEMGIPQERMSMRIIDK